MSPKVMDIVQYNSVSREGVDSEGYADLVPTRGWQWAAIKFSYVEWASVAHFWGRMIIRIMDIIGYNAVSRDCAQWHTGFLEGEE